MKLFWFILAIGVLWIGVTYAFTPPRPVPLARKVVEGLYVYEVTQLPPDLRGPVVASIRADLLASARVKEEVELEGAGWPLAAESLRILRALPEVERTGRIEVSIRLELKGEWYTMERRVALPEVEFSQTQSGRDVWSTTPTQIVLGDSPMAEAHEYGDGVVRVRWLGAEFHLPRVPATGD